MPTGCVLSSGLANHPESNRELRRIVTDAPCLCREVWIEPGDPLPPDGVEVTWHPNGHWLTWSEGGQEVRAKKREDADDPDKALA